MIWMKTAGCLAVVIVFGSAIATQAEAQTVLPGNNGPDITVLHLSANASVSVAPDQLVADLMAASTASSPATAQRHVNALIADGMAEAKPVKGVDARAVGYSVGPSGDSKKPSWTAQQTLELRSTDGPALLDLVGRLQQKGFVTSSLDWQLSPARQRQAHDDATAAALKDLRARAASAADALGLHLAYPKEVRLDGPIFQPRAMPMMAMAAAKSEAPQASAAPEDVTATVSADYVLRP